MTIRLTGDIGELTEFRHRLEEASERGKQKLLRGMAEQALSEVAEGFDGQHDPYGGKWKSTARGGEILADTGALKKSFHRKELTSNEFTIGSGVEYAAIHQSGGTIRAKNRRRVEYVRKRPVRTLRRGRYRMKQYAKYGYVHVVGFVKALTFQIGGKWISKDSVEIPQRMMVPSRSRGLPTKWKTSFREAFEEYMRALFG